MAFESGVVSNDWRSVLIIPHYKGKGEGNDCKNYRAIILLSVVGILVDRVHRLTGGLIDDEEEGFRAGSGWVDQIFTLKQIGEKEREKNLECMRVL